MKRSGFKHPRSPLKRSTKPLKRTKLRTVGKRGRAWNRARRRIKPEYERSGNIYCEAGFKGCWRDNALSFAHHSKRRKLKAGELEIVALLCIPCHDIIEVWPAARVKGFILKLIARRETAFYEAA
jgi:hypothetical protein